jgi:hypothetical protein
MGEPMDNYNEIKSKLSVYLAYIQLMMSLIPKDKGGIEINESKGFLIEIDNFLKRSNKQEIIKKGPDIISLLNSIIERYKNLCPPKKTLETIAVSFNKLCKDNKNIYSFGLDYGWVQSVMDFSRIRFLKDLPLHSKIGIGHHAGFASVEEVYLLNDAFFILVLAEESHKNMHNYAANIKESSEIKISKEVYNLLSY